jgi:hypothetical protein
MTIYNMQYRSYTEGKLRISLIITGGSGGDAFAKPLATNVDAGTLYRSSLSAYIDIAFYVFIRCSQRSSYAVDK